MSRYLAFKAAFETLAISRLPILLRQFSKAKGVIFTLHRVLPETPADFSPNAILQITPDFLEAAIVRARASGFDIVDLDEAARRIEEPGETAPFAVFTFDDAYRDNLDYALPILKKHGCPFTLYVPTALVDGVGEVWWQALEDIIASQKAIAIDTGETIRYAEAITTADKDKVFAQLYGRYRTMPEPDRVAAIRALAERYGLDLAAHCRSLIMDWAELKTFADEPLCTLGAHTVHHYELAKLPADEMREEIAQSVSIIRAQYGITPRHLSYPIGGPASAGQREFAVAQDLGFRTAVTTRPGGLYHDHAGHLTALPRVSLNGQFQEKRYLDTFLTGAVFTMLNGGKRVSVG